MYLQTSFKLSTQSYTGIKSLLFQGGVQENGAAPPIWLMISIILVRYLYSSKFATISKTAITKVAFQLVGFLYVDDTDITILNEGQETAEEVIARVQLILATWRMVLSYTRGDLKESKYF